MADETAKTSLVFDASGAQRGAEQFAAASDKVIQANDRVLKSTDRQAAALDRFAKQWNPVLAAAERAGRQLDSVFDIFQKTEGSIKTKAFELLTPAIERANKAMQDLAAGYDVAARVGQLAAKFDPVTTSARAMVGELKDLNDAQKLLNLSSGQVLAWQERIIEKYNEGAQAAKRAAQAQRDLIEQGRAEQARSNASAAQGAFNQQLGVGQPGKSAAQSASVFQENYEEQQKHAALLQQLTNKYDPLTAAAQRYAATISEINLAEKEIGIGSAEAQKLRDAEAKSYGASATNVDAATKYLGNFRDAAFGARFASQQLGVQTIQFFSSLQAGQPFMQAFIGQAHQVVDVAIATGTGFRTIADAVKGWVTSLTGWVRANPIVAGATAAAAAIIGLAALAESRAQRMQALSNQLGAQRPNDFVKATADADFAARRLAATTDTSSKESLAAMTALYRDPAFKGTPEQAVALATSFEKLSKAMGGTKPGSDALREMLKDPAEFTRQLVAEFKNLDPELAKQVERFQNSGKEAQAFEVALKAVNEATKNVAQTPLSAALTRLAAAFHPVTTAAIGAVNAIGSVFTNLATSLINDVAAIIETISKIPVAIGNAASAIARGIGSILPSRQPEANPAPWNRTRGAPPGSAAAGTQTATSASGFADTAADTARRANALTESLGLTSEAVKKLQDNEQLLTRALAQAEAAANPGKIKEYGEAVDVVRGKLYEAVSAQEQFARQLEQQARIAQATTEGDQKFLQVQEQINQLNKQHPEGRSAENEARAMNAVLQESHGQFGKMTADMGQQIDASNRLAEAYGKGYDAAAKQQNENEALTESLKLYKKGTDEQIYAEKDLAATHDLVTAATQRLTAAQRQATNRDTEQLIRGEASALGASALARERLINHLKTEIELKKDLSLLDKERNEILAKSDELFAKQQAIDAINSINTVSETLRKLKETRDILNKQATEAKTAGDVSELTQKQKALQGEIYSTVGAQEQMARSMEQQVRISAALTEGDQKLIQVQEQLNELDRQHPDTASQEARARVIAAALQDQVNQYRRLTFETGQQIDAQNKLAAAYGDGYAAVARQTAANQALIESMRLFPRDSAAQKAAAQQLTAVYEAQAAATQRAQAAQMAAQNRDTITLMNAEIDTLGKDSLERERYLNHIRTELELKRQLPLLSEEARQALLRETDAIFEQQQQLQVHKAAMDEIANSVSQSFETIGNSITQAFVQGEGAAVNWSNVLKGVLQQAIQQFTKLAILNPALNALFPGSQHRPTLDDAFNEPQKITSTAKDTLAAITGGAGGLPIDPTTGAVKVVSVGLGGLLGGGGAAGGAGPLGAVTNAASSLARNAIPGRSQLDLVQVQSPSGVSFTVDKSVAKSFEGFLGDLEGTGYKINQGESGGYNPRNIAGTNTPSLHAFGRAIDINSAENPQGSSGAQDMPSNVAEMARRWGLTWGGNWSGKTRDPMHFEVPLAGSTGSAVAAAANDNSGGLLGKAMVGGMPIDVAANAMRVTIVGNNDLTDAAKAAADSATPANASVKAAADAADAASSTASDTKEVGTASAQAESSGGGLLSRIGKAIGGMFGGGSSVSGVAGGGGSGGGSGGGGFLGSIGKLLGNFPGGLLNSVFGDKFYENGGLIGSLFGSGGGNNIPVNTGDPQIFSDAGIVGGAQGIQDSGAWDVPAAHTGGLIGVDQFMRRSVHPAAFIGAPRLHTGLGSNEFAAVLQRGERVLTANHNMRLENMLGSALPRAGGAGAAAMSRAMSGMAANRNARGGDVNNNGHTIHVNVAGPMSGDQARRTGYQVANAVAGHLQKSAARSASR
jgi:hypothetical protein